MTGAPVSRVDGLVKVTGAARYAAEVPVEGAAYGALVKSTVACGRIQSINTREAEQSPGVLRVLTNGNAPDDLRIPQGDEPIPVLDGTRIYFGGQTIGVVVAETLEQARHAARLVRVDYEVQDPRGDLDALMGQAFVPEGEEERLNFRKGDLDDRTAAVVMTHSYARDRDLVGALAASPVSYLGLLGSRRRRAALMADLAEAGVVLAPDRLRSPVGLNIGSEAPEEIALATCAEVISLARLAPVALPA